MNTDRHERDAVSERIIGCAFAVSNVLGCGFLEKIYENALALELRSAGSTVEQQHGIIISYQGTPFIDLLVEALS